MEFLVVPLYVVGVILGVLTLAGIVITACQRSDVQPDTLKYAIYVNRTKYLLTSFVSATLMFTAASFVDHNTTPSFRTLYQNCLSATDSEGKMYRGTIQRQSSCVVIAREIQKSIT